MEIGTAIIFAFFNLALRIIAEKWNIVTLYESKKHSKFPAWCDFCFFFWCSLVTVIFSYELSPQNYFCYSLVIAAISSFIFAKFISN